MIITTRVMAYLTIATVSISFLNLLNHCFSTIYFSSSSTSKSNIYPHQIGHTFQWIYIGFTTSPKRYAMRRLKPVLNYFSSLTNDDIITFLSSLNAMVSLSLFPVSISTISPSPKTLCITLSPMENFAIYLFLLMYAITTKIVNMMMTIICIGN